MVTESRGEAPAYSLAAVRSGQAGVPRIFIDSLPGSTGATTTRARKEEFLKSLLPLALHANEAIERDKFRLHRIMEAARSGRPLSRRARRNLSKLARRYKVSPDDLIALKRRIDVIPPSLVLAQAAIESGWGTSRFAREGRALFGIRTWSRRGGKPGGLIPRQRPVSARHAVKIYDDLAGSVRAYMRTLNTHPAYRDFRRRRAQLRMTGGPLDTLELAPGLTRYAETGPAYVKLVIEVMKKERLWEFDRARLSPN